MRSNGSDINHLVTLAICILKGEQVWRRHREEDCPKFKVDKLFASPQSTNEPCITFGYIDIPLFILSKQS